MNVDSLFSGPAPRVYTLPSAAPFLVELARGLLEAFPDPRTLRAVTVLIPTRRAKRELIEAFARFKSGATLLPVIHPIGNVDADEPPFEPGELAAHIPKAIPDLRRRFELTRLIMRKEDAAGRSIGVGGALALADDMGLLIDDLATEEVNDLSSLTQEIRATLPAHMQEAALFLDIILQAWPERLKELECVDPARRRSLMLKALTQRWHDTPPDDPVIAAGLTGSIPAAAELMRVIARLPRGCVVLPGLARDMDARAWEAIDPAHPQSAMKTLIGALGVDRNAVRFWPGAEESRDQAPRARVIAEALRPAQATADWLDQVEILKSVWGKDVFSRALHGLGVIEAPTPAMEARAIALMMRETLETPQGRTVLVTPDRALSRRVSVEMARFGVTVDNSAGQPLSDTPPGAFLMRVLQAAHDPGSALAFTALTASPLFALGKNRATLRPTLGAIERKALRGRRPGHSLEALSQHVLNTRYFPHSDQSPEALSERERNKRYCRIVKKVNEGLEPLTTLNNEQPIKTWTEALIKAAETLAETDQKSGADRLWVGDAGEAARQLMQEFMKEADMLAPVSLHDFIRILLETARGRLVRPGHGAHPRLQILGPLEARLVSADRVILAGLNEGTWPSALKADPFLSRSMRQVVGLPDPEERFGRDAHGFAQLACSPEVILTRSTRVDGAPTMAARWLWRLKTLVRGALGAAADKDLKTPVDYLALASALDTPNKRTFITPPAPKPPVQARPRRLGVTRIETWIRDPYAIFASKILKLRKLEPLDCASGPSERGTAYHKALERWIKELKNNNQTPRDSLSQLLIHGRDALLEAGFTESATGIEMIRFERMARFIVEWEENRRRDGFRPLVLEKKGELEIEAPFGAFTLTGCVDRIDLRPCGKKLDILDYKTGMPPSRNEVKAGFAPQLPLEAAMAARGALEDAPAYESGGLTYVRVSGGRVPGEVKSIAEEDESTMLAEETLKEVAKWIARFDNVDQSYPSQPRVKFTNTWGDYDHLARRKEWANAPGDEMD